MTKGARPARVVLLKDAVRQSNGTREVFATAAAGSYGFRRMPVTLIPA